MTTKLLLTLYLILLLSSVEAQTFIKRRYSKGFFHEQTIHKTHVAKNKTSSQEERTVNTFSGEKTGVLSAPKIKTQKKVRPASQKIVEYEGILTGVGYSLT